VAAGGGAALLHASKALDEVKGKLDNFDQKIGVQIIQVCRRKAVMPLSCCATRSCMHDGVAFVGSSGASVWASHTIGE
jgi:hypothetical protein